jgi:hypothetical protein
MPTRISRSVVIFVVLAAIGAGLRAYCSTRGYNWDTGMLLTIAQLPFGANFYREMPVYANWGPLPYNIFQVFRSLPGGQDIIVFHSYLAAFATMCDLLTAFVVWRLWGLSAAGWFLLSPVAIVIAGFHCNAEPAIVAMVLLGYFVHVRRGGGEQRLDTWFLVCLGVSLAFKHSFVLFPIWLVLRPVSWRERLRILAIPYAVWLAFFLYYVIPNPRYVMNNVLAYSAWSGNALVPTVHTWLKGLGAPPLRWSQAFLGMMLLIGLGIRKWRVERLLLLYPLALLATTSAIALQYFALAPFSVAASIDPIGVMFSAFALYFYAGHAVELNLFHMPQVFVDHGAPNGYFNWGWLLMQALLGALLIRRMITWSRADRIVARSRAIEAREQKRNRFFELTDQLVHSRDVADQKRLTEELARMTLGE